MRRILNSRSALSTLLSLPVAWWLYAGWSGAMFYGELIHATGVWSARLVILTLAVTAIRRCYPAAKMSRWLLERRRQFGIAAFAYAALHAIIYLDRKRSLDLVLQEGSDAALWTGWLALAVFLVMAATSNDAAVRVFKRGWKALHRLTYPATVLLLVHWILTAFDPLPGLLHAGLVALLLATRVWLVKRRRATASL